MREAQHDLVIIGTRNEDEARYIGDRVGRKVELPHLHAHHTIGPLAHKQLYVVVAKLVGWSPRPTDQPVRETDAVGLAAVSRKGKVKPARHDKVHVLLEAGAGVTGTNV